jgi:hypothetical protein
MKTMRLEVIDAMEAPHGGWILRLRHREGAPLTVKGLKGARMKAVSPRGDERTFRIHSFVMFGGKPTDRRLARTGRADVRIVDEEAAPGTPPIGLRWDVIPNGADGG